MFQYPMLWIYRRNGEQLFVEMRIDSVGNEYSLRVVQPDGNEQFERFASEQAFRRRLREFEMALGRERWVGPSSSLVINRSERPKDFGWRLSTVLNP